MTEQNNVIQLKKLAAKIIGGDTSPDSVVGKTITDILKFTAAALSNNNAEKMTQTTIAELLEIIAENFSSGGSDTPLGTLTVKSQEGDWTGATNITISPTIGENHHYYYKVTASKIDLPKYKENISNWTYLSDNNNVVTLNITDGQYISVCETDENSNALAGGGCIVVSNVG